MMLLNARAKRARALEGEPRRGLVCWWQCCLKSTFRSDKMDLVNT